MEVLLRKSSKILWICSTICMNLVDIHHKTPMKIEKKFVAEFFIFYRKSNTVNK